jgi:hypothetical protein
VGLTDLNLRPWLFWDVRRRRLLFYYRRFEEIYRSYIQGSISSRRMDVLSFEDEYDSCPETSVINNEPTQRNIPEERRTQLHRCGSLNLVQILSFSCTLLPKYLTASLNTDYCCAPHGAIVGIASSVVIKVP